MKKKIQQCARKYVSSDVQRKKIHNFNKFNAFVRFGFSMRPKKTIKTANWLQFIRFIVNFTCALMDLACLPARCHFDLKNYLFSVV